MKHRRFVQIIQIVLLLISMLFAVMAYQINIDITFFTNIDSLTDTYLNALQSQRQMCLIISVLSFSIVAITQFTIKY